MGQTHRFRLDKLVRDKYPEIMEAKKVTVAQRILDQDSEYINCLKDKISEEVREAIEAKEEHKRIEELADTLEAFHCLCSAYDLTYKAVEEAREKKQVEKGSYSSGIYVDSIEMEEGNALLIKYLSKSEQYPEIK